MGAFGNRGGQASLLETDEADPNHATGRGHDSYGEQLNKGYGSQSSFRSADRASSSGFAGFEEAEEGRPLVACRVWAPAGRRPF